MSVKIQIISDLHLEFMDNLPEFLNNDYIKAEYLFLAGDIGYVNYPEYNTGLFYEFIAWCCNNYKKIFYVMGNHESYDTDMINVKKSLLNISKEKTNFIFLDVDVTSNIKNYKVIGCTLWSHPDRDGYQYMNDKNFIKINNEPIKREDIINIHKEHKKWLRENLNKNTIVMTHHLPSFYLIHPDFNTQQFEKYNSAYASECDDIVKKAKCWIYGHTHKANDTILFNTRCICNPVGYINEDKKKTGFTSNYFIL